ncbi:signal transduction histidine kinase [Malaciobacter marinus]|uniref:histidine kinase n=1 Tax=Malaciobacter marinus TaxID=505249 RepID=A0AB37A0U8_9BACT|nr:HAMP domain-containing sensor histidine kinase [Malaciobacter marinus]PPK62684.1 signal transduction histidine kinase [Malaciobacter marinus]SKB47465.1 Signal transduction histidine kinase [Malaciobacter marinus]
MINLSIKRKLLIYNIFIQVLILMLFSFSIYKTLEISSKDKLEATLKVILLDIVDDIIEHKKELISREFDEEKEYKFEPLYIRLLKEENKYKEIKNTNFPSDIKIQNKYLKALTLNYIDFEYKEQYIISRLKIQMDKNYYVLEVATNFSTINSTLENLIYILLFIVPIILVLSIIGGYFLIYKSFLPIEKLLQNLKSINASDLSKRLESKNKNDEIDLLSQEINNLLQRLEISFNQISQFSSDASHELKTPLTIIRGEIEIALRKDRSLNEYKNTLSNCLDEILTIQQTINDLLFLAKNEHEVLERKEEDIYLDEVSLEAYKEMQSFAKLKNINLLCQIKEPIQIKGHHKLLKIAIKNILKNAITFSYENTAVTISNYKDRNNNIICIEDKGIGISKQDQEKIFDKFYRTDKSRNKESGGTGLGMSIVEKIVKIHKGEIKLQSEENIGTKVYFIFKGTKL